jgi:predicted DNA-binding antitoxin AbrB/MazE fold protein
MAIHLDAVYEHGVSRPLEPLALAEHPRVHVTVDERKRPLSWESAHQPDDSRAELDWLANESRHYAGEWVALDRDRLVAHGPKLAAVKAAAQAARVSRPFFASVPRRRSAIWRLVVAYQIEFTTIHSYGSERDGISSLSEGSPHLGVLDCYCSLSLRN